MARKARDQPVVVGWREWVAFPDLGVARIKAKLDTGARTSALHAYRLKVDESRETATFEIHPVQRSTADAVEVSLPIVSWRAVRSSSGHSERRPVVKTKIRLDGRTWPIELTLTARDEMGFRLLIGRSALRRKFVVDPGKSFLTEGGTS